jgi:hypothetical protein
VCTLTIYSGKKRCVVTMNRDELRTRKESGLLHSHSGTHARLHYPVDVASGGTWFGVNNRGVILCLLNRYEAPQREGARSRGDIVPRALEQGGFDKVADWLQKLDASPYNPFDAFLVTRKKIMRFSWDGYRYSVDSPEPRHWTLFSSSGLMTEEVTAFRQSFFRAWSQEIGKKLTDADEILRGFHLIQIDGMETHSVLMERERSHTKSVIQAVLEGKSLKLRYFPDILEKFPGARLGDAQVETIQVIRE